MRRALNMDDLSLDQGTDNGFAEHLVGAARDDRSGEGPDP